LKRAFWWGAFRREAETGGAAPVSKADALTRPRPVRLATNEKAQQQPKVKNTRAAMPPYII